MDSTWRSWRRRDENRRIAPPERASSASSPELRVASQNQINRGYDMKTYTGISTDDKHRIISALKAKGAGSCPRCTDSKWTVSEYSRIEVQATVERNSAGGATIPAVMIVCQHCGFISQHALQPLGLWEHGATAHAADSRELRA
jgi:hypothetical protein